MPAPSVSSALSTTSCGFIQNVYICLAIGVVLVVAALFVIRAITAKKPLPGFEDVA